MSKNFFDLKARHEILTKPSLCKHEEYEKTPISSFKQSVHVKLVSGLVIYSMSASYSITGITLHKVDCAVTPTVPTWPESRPRAVVYSAFTRHTDY